MLDDTKMEIVVDVWRIFGLKVLFYRNGGARHFSALNETCDDTAKKMFNIKIDFQHVATTFWRPWSFCWQLFIMMCKIASKSDDATVIVSRLYCRIRCWFLNDSQWCFATSSYSTFKLSSPLLQYVWGCLASHIPLWMQRIVDWVCNFWM